jgi:hypothetical protein
MSTLAKENLRVASKMMQNNEYDLVISFLLAKIDAYECCGDKGKLDLSAYSDALGRAFSNVGHVEKAADSFENAAIFLREYMDAADRKIPPDRPPRQCAAEVDEGDESDIEDGYAETPSEEMKFAQKQQMSSHLQRAAALRFRMKAFESSATLYTKALSTLNDLVVNAEQTREESCVGSSSSSSSSRSPSSTVRDLQLMRAVALSGLGSSYLKAKRIRKAVSPLQQSIGILQEHIDHVLSNVKIKSIPESSNSEDGALQTALFGESTHLLNAFDSLVDCYGISQEWASGCRTADATVKALDRILDLGYGVRIPKRGAGKERSCSQDYMKQEREVLSASEQQCKALRRRRAHAMLSHGHMLKARDEKRREEETASIFTPATIVELDDDVCEAAACRPADDAEEADADEDAVRARICDLWEGAGEELAEHAGDWAQALNAYNGAGKLLFQATGIESFIHAFSLLCAPSNASGSCSIVDFSDKGVAAERCLSVYRKAALIASRMADNYRMQRDQYIKGDSDGHSLIGKTETGEKIKYVDTAYARLLNSELQLRQQAVLRYYEAGLCGLSCGEVERAVGAFEGAKTAGTEYDRLVVEATEVVANDDEAVQALFSIAKRVQDAQQERLYRVQLGDVHYHLAQAHCKAGQCAYALEEVGQSIDAFSFGQHRERQRWAHELKTLVCAALGNEEEVERSLATVRELCLAPIDDADAIVASVRKHLRRFARPVDTATACSSSAGNRTSERAAKEELQEKASARQSTGIDTRKDASPAEAEDGAHGSTPRFLRLLNGFLKLAVGLAIDLGERAGIRARATSATSVSDALSSVHVGGDKGKGSSKAALERAKKSLEATKALAARSAGDDCGALDYDMLAAYTIITVVLGMLGLAIKIAYENGSLI